MKFLLFLCSALARKLNPAAPFDALSASKYEQFLSVNPNIAAGTGRPDCLDGKCHLKHNVTGGEIYVEVKFDKQAIFGYKENSVGKWTELNSYPDLDEDYKEGVVKAFGYRDENFIVENGGACELDGITWTHTKTLLTIHLQDYLGLLGDEIAVLKLDQFDRVLVITPGATVGLVPKGNVFWIVSSQAEGKLLDANNKEIYANILIQEKAELDGEALVSDDTNNFC